MEGVLSLVGYLVILLIVIFFVNLDWGIIYGCMGIYLGKKDYRS